MQTGHGKKEGNHTTHIECVKTSNVVRDGMRVFRCLPCPQAICLPERKCKCVKESWRMLEQEPAEPVLSCCPFGL